MAHYAITVSDLHLGRGNDQDDFAADDLFQRFCGDIAAFCRSAGHQLTFVLNGDIIDFWEIAPDDELAVDAGELIAREIIYPAETPTEQQRGVDRAVWQIKEALAAHPSFVSGLKSIMSVHGAKVFYTVGNHDHVVASPVVQEELRSALAAGGVPDVSSRIEFGHCVYVPEVRAYFEHGHQCHRSDSSYEDVGNPWIETTGYYFLRFVWNRLQAHYGYEAKLGDYIRIVLMVARDPEHQKSRNVLRFVADYFVAVQVGIAPLAHGPAGILRRVYDHWQDLGSPLVPTSKQETELRNFIAAEKISEPESAAAISTDGIAPDESPLGFPGRGRFLNTQQGKDGYMKGVRSRYDGPSPPFPTLPSNARGAVLGHTHRELYTYLRNTSGSPAAGYVNSGSWTHGSSRHGFAWITEGTKLRRAMGLSIYG